MTHRQLSARELATAYDEIYHRAPLEDGPRLYRWVAKLAQLNPGVRVLDLGCGTGGAARAAQELGAATTCLELSNVALSLARQRLATGAFVLGDGAHLPFADQSFDCVFNLGNLEHFAELERGISEMRRVLKPQGRAWILLPNLYYSGSVWRAIRTGYGPNHHQPIDRFATRSEWRDLLASQGLAVHRSRPYHKGKWWKRFLPANLAWHFLYETGRGDRSAAAALPPLTRLQPPGAHRQ
ncbi:MAG: class I SAM-dependent methyltransferase [Planctomycetota bacterium]